MNAPRWYMVNKHGIATLCTDEEDAKNYARDANSAFETHAHYRAVQMVEVTGCGLGRDDVLRLAIEAGAGTYLPAEAGLPATWVGQDFDMLERFATLVAASERIKHADAIALAECMKMFRNDMLKAEIIDPYASPMFMTEAILSAIQKERAARQSAQAENAELKERLARAGVEQRRAVHEAVLAEREACKADAQVLEMQRDSLHHALEKVLTANEKYAVCAMRHENAMTNFIDHKNSEKEHERAMLDANNAEREARLLLLTMRTAIRARSTQ